MAEDKADYYKNAIEFHLKHKEIADVAGKFLAHVNLGIIYSNLDDQEKSSIKFLGNKCLINKSSRPEVFKICSQNSAEKHL